MKFIFGLGFAAAMTCAAPIVQAQSQSGWSGSFLNRSNEFTARRMDGPTVPEVDPATLPSAVTTQPVNTYHNYGTSTPSYGASTGHLTATGSGCATGNCGSGYTTAGYGASNCESGGCSTGIASVVGGCGCSPWFGGVNGLIMTRSDDFDTYLSWDGVDASTPVMRTGSADFGYAGGVEASVGRYLSQCWGVQASYWGLYPDDQSSTIYNTDTVGGLFSAINYTGLGYDNGTGGQDAGIFYGQGGGTASAAHRISRSFQAHNFELNFIRNPYRRSNCSPVHFELLAGFRYLRLDDGLVFSSAYTNDTFGADPNNELHHVIDVENHLAGFQLGGRADRYFLGCWGAHLGTKFGVYNNRVNHRQRLFGGNGNAYVQSSNEDYSFRNNDDQVAFVGELFAGVSYDINPCWRLTGGYRAIAASGVAQSTSQFPREREFASVVRSGQVDAEDTLVLHGAYFGLEYNW